MTEQMENIINCKDGIAYMSLCPGSTNILICESLVDVDYWTLPWSFTILDIFEFDIILNEQNCYKCLCELKVELLSANSICLRLYNKKDDGDEGEKVSFSIKTCELLKIAKMYLLEVKK